MGGHGGNKPSDLQVSMGWAASPIRTSRSLCHLGIGPLATSFQNLTSLAFLPQVYKHSMLRDVVTESTRFRTHLITVCRAGAKCFLAYSKGTLGLTMARKSRYHSALVISIARQFARQGLARLSPSPTWEVSNSRER